MHGRHCWTKRRRPTSLEPSLSQASLATREPMFDHVKFGVSDYEASTAFFLAALAPLGLSVGSEGTPTYGVELCTDANASLCLYQTDERPAHLHLAFVAANR